MKVLGFILLTLGAIILYFSAFVGTSGSGLARHAPQVANLPGTLLGSALFLAGAIFIAAGQIIEVIAPDAPPAHARFSLIPEPVPAFNGATSLTDEGYQIFLARIYKIEKSNVFDRYICADKLFDTFKDAMKYAHALYSDRATETGKIGLNKFTYEVRPEYILVRAESGIARFSTLKEARLFFNANFTARREAVALAQRISEQSRSNIR